MQEEWRALIGRPDFAGGTAWGPAQAPAAGTPRALLVGTEAPGPTGDDRTFWVTDSGWPDARIVEAMGQAGLAAEFLAGGGGLKLFVLTGYVQAEDIRLDGAPGGLTGVIGAAPVF